jgi:hypothetical protein
LLKTYHNYFEIQVLILRTFKDIVQTHVMIHRPIVAPLFSLPRSLVCSCFLAQRLTGVDRPSERKSVE